MISWTARGLGADSQSHRMLAAINWTAKAALSGIFAIPATIAVFVLFAQAPSCRVAFRRGLVPVFICLLVAAFFPDLPGGRTYGGFSRGPSIRLAWKQLSSEQRWALRAEGAAWYLAFAIPATLVTGWFGRRYASPD